MVAFPDNFVKNSALNGKYTACSDNPAAVLVPEMRWAPPTGGPQCEHCQTFAVTVADLDYPHGVGSGGNHVQGLFWAANIPSDWTELSEEKLAGGGQGVVVGRNSVGALGMAPICPKQGKHRIRVTIWAVKSALPGLGPDTPYSELMDKLECAEIARATSFAEVAAAAPAPVAAAVSFLQRGSVG